MKKKTMRHPRAYIVIYYTGRDICDATFYSEHRANSKLNYEDARDHLRCVYGRRVSVGDIRQTYLTEVD